MKKILTTLCAALLAVTVSQAAEPLHVKLFPEGTLTKNGLEEQPESITAHKMPKRDNKPFFHLSNRP